MYSHIFFDLDHTLWDFEKNSSECLFTIYEENHLQAKGTESFEVFYEQFSVINKKLWSLLDRNLITHQELRRSRFKDTFFALGIEIDYQEGNLLNERFLELLPHKSHLIEGAREILEYLKEKYQLHIITNGFDEVQAKKMKSSEIFHYFDVIVTNEKANARKPHPGIFHYALQSAGAEKIESLMVGDNFEADVLGAISAGIDCVFYNPEELIIDTQPTYTIKHLNELKTFL